MAIILHSDLQFVVKVADFGLAHASKDGSICFEPVNTEIRGTPGKEKHVKLFSSVV